MADKSDNELMNEFTGCSEPAFRELMSRYKKRLFNYILRGFLNDPDIAEDIVQKTFIKVYEYKFRYSPSYQFSTWLYTISRNFTLNELKRKRTVRIEGDDALGNFGITSDIEDFITMEEKENLKNLFKLVLQELKPKYREIIVMRYFDEMSFEEISKVTGKNQNTLKSLAKRGLEQVRNNLEKAGFNGK